MFKPCVFPFPSHSTVRSAAWVEIVGAVESLIVNVADEVEVFPQESVAVKITVAVPVAPHVSETEVKLLLQVTSEQLSEATAPPLEASQVFKPWVFPFPSHSTVRSAACVEIVGAVESLTVIVWDTVVKLPHISVAVQVRTNK